MQVSEECVRRPAQTRQTTYVDPRPGLQQLLQLPLAARLVRRHELEVAVVRQRRLRQARQARGRRADSAGVERAADGQQRLLGVLELEHLPLERRRQLLKVRAYVGHLRVDLVGDREHELLDVLRARETGRSRS